MGLWRPATKIRFWTPAVRNRPYVQPPGLLKLVSALSILSIVGTMIFAVLVTLGDGVSSSGIDPRRAAYVAVLHFLLPFSIAVSISTNSRLSRPLIVAYSLILALATAAGEGFLGALGDDRETASVVTIAAFAVFAAVVAWLYLGARTRAYYALLSGDTVPGGTGDEAVRLVTEPWPGEKGRKILEWVADHLETLVIVGLIVAVVLALISMDP